MSWAWPSSLPPVSLDFLWEVGIVTMFMSQGQGEAGTKRDKQASRSLP